MIDTTSNAGAFIASIIAIAIATATLWLLVVVVRWAFAMRGANADTLDYVMAVSCAGASVFALALVLIS